MSREAAAILDELVQHYVNELSAMAPLPQNEVDHKERESILAVVIRKERAGMDRVVEVIEQGLYPRYLGHSSLPKLLYRRPEIVLDGSFFTIPFVDVPNSLRQESLEQVIAPIRDLLWVASPETINGTGSEWHSRMTRAVASLQLLSLWRS